MNAILEQINSTGKAFVEFAVPMLVQSGVLIVILLLVDLVLRKKVKAVFRYCIWMLVLMKLILPTSLSSPLSVGYWFGDHLAYVAESRTSAAPEAEVEAEEPALANMLHIIETVPIETGRHTPVELPVMPDAETIVTEAIGPPTVPVTPVTWQGVVFLVWLAVVIAMGLLMLQRAMFVRGLVAQAKEASDLMNDALKYCCKCMGVKRKVGLKVSAASSPAVCGLFRPVILLPRKLAPSLGSRGLRAVLLHELAHIRRRDLWVNLIQTVLQIVYFYNPLLWLANCVIRRVREQAIDETVLVAMGEKAQQYPQTLVNVAKLAFKRPVLSLRLIGVVESKSALAGRIKHILNRPMPRSAKIGVVGVLAVIIAGAILLPMAREAGGENRLVGGGKKEVKVSAGDKEQIGKLVERLKSKDEAVWKPAAEKLKKIGPKVAEQVAGLFRAVPGDIHAIKVLESMATDEHVQGVMVGGLSADPHRTNSNVRHCSLIILSKSGNRGHVKRIVPLLRKDVENGEDYSMAAIALGRLGGDEAYIALCDAVARDTLPTLCWVIAEQLLKFNNPDAIKHLEAASDKLHIAENEFGPKRRVNDCIYKLSGGSVDFSNEFAMPIYDRNARSFGQYIGGNLSRFDTDYIKLERYGLSVGADPEELFEKQGKCSFYMKEGHEFVGVRGTVIAPVILPYLDPGKNWTWVDRLRLLYPKQVVDQIKDHIAETSTGSSIKLRENDVYGVITPEGKLLAMRVSDFGTYKTGAQATTLTFIMLGNVDINSLSKRPVEETNVKAASLEHFVGKYAMAGHPDTAAFEITKKGDIFIFSDLGGPKFEMGIILRGLEGRKFEMEKGEDNLKFGDSGRDRFCVRYDASENRYSLDKLGMRGEVQDAVAWQLTELVKLSEENPEKSDVWIGIEKSISPKLVMLLGAINSCAAQTKFNIESISITAKNINIEGDTSGRTNTRKFLDAIKKNELEILQLNLDARGGRDKFRIIVEPKKNWQMWWQQHKTDVRLGIEETISPELVMLLGAINSCAAETKLKIESIFIRSGKINIAGDTSDRTNTQKFLDSIRKNELEILQYRVSARDKRDKFSIVAEPKKELTVHTSRPFSATLANGVTVELVGVTNHYIQSERPAKQTWWDPSGKILEKMPYTKLGWSEITDYRNSNYEFAIRIDGQEEYTCAAETSLSRSRRFPNIPKTRNDESLPNIRAFIGDFRKEDKEGNIRFGVATSSWHEVEVWRDGWTGGEAYNVSTHSKSSVVYEWPRQDGNKVVIEVTHTLANEDRRLLIVDKDDRIHIGDGRKFVGEGAGIVRDIYYFDNLDRKDMEVLKFEKRPYEWVEFKNVSLRPGHKTDVQVEGARAKETASQQLSFGPVTERVLSFNFSKDSAHLDLDTGRYGKEQPGRDLIAAAGESDRRVRSGLDMVTIPVEAKRWESSPQEVLDEVAKGKPQRQARLGGPESRRTFFFKTREGSVGVLQILPLQDSSGSVKVSYKLVRGRQDVRGTESRNVTRHRGVFKINEEMPVNLDCPVVKDVWGNDQRPFKVETVEFAEKEERLHCSVKIGGATAADGKFIVRVNIRGKESRDSAREVLFAVREFLFETLCFYADLPLVIGEVQDLDFGSIPQFAMATSFEVVIEDITQRVETAKKQQDVTTFRGAFKKGEPIPVNLACPVVKDVWGKDQRPFKVESVEFVKKDDHLHCSVKIDGATSADGKFIVWVKIYDRESRGEGIVDPRGFIFETQCFYGYLPTFFSEVEKLDFGPVFEDVTSFEVEIVDITGKAESAEGDSKIDVPVEVEKGRDSTKLVQSLEELKNGGPRGRESAAQELGKLRDPRAVGALIAALKDTDVGVRKAAARALGNIRDERAVEPLIEAYQDKEYESFIDAIWALGDIGGARAEEILVQALNYHGYHPYVRNIAAKCLTKLGWEPANREQKIRYLIALEKWEQAIKSGPSASLKPAGTNQAEGLFELNIPIVIPLEAEKQSPAIAKCPWLQFSTAQGKLKAALDIQYSSWPHTKWVMKIDVLDAGGKVLGQAKSIHSNSGIIEKYILVENAEILFGFHRGFELTDAARFRFSIESFWTSRGNPIQFSKELPLALELNSAEQSRTIRAQWLKFQKNGDRVEGTIHLDYLSWPKAKWEVGVYLLDENGTQLTGHTAIIENSGVIVGQPVMTMKDFRFSLEMWGDVSKAVRYGVTLQRILDSTAKTDVPAEVERKAGSVVQGKVLGPQGEPVKGATVELQIFVGGDVDDMSNYRAQRVFTDANGLYVFEGLQTDANGLYVFKALETGSAGIGRAFTTEDGSMSGVPYGLMFDFEIRPGKSYDITLGGKGRPVIGRLVPASGNAADIDWSKAWADFGLRAAPMTMGFMEDNLKILRAMIKSEGGNFYRKETVKINPDGTFRIDNVRAGRYMLRVKVIEEPKREGFNLFRDLRIPLMRDGTTETPLNLGTLAVSHGDYKAPRHIENHFLDSLTLDKDIPVILKAGNDEEPDVVSAKSIRFGKDGELLTAALGVEWKSIVADRWRVRLTLLRGNGSYVAGDDVFFETFKIIERYPQLFKETLNFSLGRQLDLSAIPRFTITIQPVSEILTGSEQLKTGAVIGRADAERVKVGAFEELLVKFGGIWMHWQDVEFTVRGDGSVEFSMNKGPNDKTRYKTAFKLSNAHLAELSGLLQKTNWLTDPGANVQPGYTDATRIDISLTRQDKVQKVWCHDRNAEPYLSLIIFLKRIQRQEYLLYQMTVPGAFGRNSAFHDIYQQIRAERGEPVSLHPHPILDFSRFVPVSIDVITHPDDSHYETVAIAARILGKLKAEQVRRQITDLTTAERKKHYDTAAVIRTERIRAAAVEVLTELGGEQARLHIRDMAKNHTSWRRRVNEAIVEGLLRLDRDNCAELLKDMAAKTNTASWGLIRLGPRAIPAILEMLEVRDTKYMGQIYLIRQYIDNWENVAKPIDPRVIEAVQNNLDYRLGRSTSWTNYHKEFLQLAGAPELPGKNARQIAEEFLAAVKTSDQMKIGVVALTRGGSWPRRLAEFRALPHLQQLEITEVYADTNDNLAWAVAAVASPDNENSTQSRIILNFLSGSVWRVFNIAVERPEIGNRMTRRFLERHPNAKPVSAKASSGTGLKSGVKVEGEETSRMSALVWGQVVDGLKAVLSCKSKAIAGGEPVIVELSLLNESDKNITYYDFKKHNLGDDGHVATVLVDGKAVGGYTTLDVSAESNKAMVVRGRDNRDTGPGIIVPIPPIPREAFQVLKPGEKTTYLKVDLQPAWFKHVTEKNHKGPLQIPGEYTIEVEYHNTAGGEQFNLKAWTGRVKSNTVKVHIGAARSTAVLSMEVKNLLRKLEGLEDEHLKIRKEKVESMSDAEKRRLVTHNMAVTSGMESELRTLSGETARQMAAFGEAAVPILLEELRNLSTGVHYQRRSIARSLRQIGRPAVPYLIEALRAGGPRDKVALARYKDVIISTLGEIRDSRAVEPLLVLFDKNKESRISWRASIATALGFICDKRAVEPLIFELDACLGRAQESGEWDADGLDMRAYAGALGRLGDSRAIPVLKRALNAGPQTTNAGKEYVLAKEAAQALRSLGVQVEGKDKTLILRLGDKTDVEVEGTGQKEPKITFEKVVHDFGEIAPGTKHSCEFKFTNTGDGLLKITKIKECCSISTGLRRREYAPGESGTIKVTYKAGSKTSGTSKQLYVNSNDKKNPRVTLTIKARIVVKVEHKPEKLELLLKDENAGCPEITLTGLDNQPFAITQFKSTANSITADFEASVKKTKFVLEPKVDMEKLQRSLNGRISISLTHPQCRTVTIPFSTLSRFKITPPTLITLKAESQKPTKRKVRILNNYNEDFEIESASSQKGIVKVLGQEKTRGGYQFELEITPPVAEGNKRLFTDVFIVNIKGGEVLKISCRGFYSRK